MDKTGKIILVAGATGRQGGAVARELLRQGWPVRALTRHPEGEAALKLAAQGAEVLQGDLMDRATLDRALAGVYGVFSMQNYGEHGYGAEVQQGRNLADAAQAAGVQHYVQNSTGGAERSTGIPHFESKWEIEKHLRALRLPATIFRPVWFMDNLLRPAQREAILGQGELRLGLRPDTPLQMIAVENIGGFVALALDNPREWIGRTLEIAGDEKTGPQMAEAFSRVLGREVRFAPIPLDELRRQDEGRAKQYEWFQHEGYQADLRALHALYPPLLRFESWLRKAGWDKLGREATAGR